LPELPEAEIFYNQISTAQTKASPLVCNVVFPRAKDKDLYGEDLNKQLTYQFSKDNKNGEFITSYQKDFNAALTNMMGVVAKYAKKRAATAELFDASADINSTRNQRVTIVMPMGGAGIFNTKKGLIKDKEIVSQTNMEKVYAAAIKAALKESGYPDIDVMICTDQAFGRGHLEYALKKADVNCRKINAMTVDPDLKKNNGKNNTNDKGRG
jgi:hypothetical protein